MKKSKVLVFLFKIFLQITFAALLIVGTNIWCGLRSMEKAPVPLTMGLGGEWAVVSKEFDRRVKAAFPLGSSVSDMGQELSRQGFIRQDWTDWTIISSQEHKAMRREDFIPCNKAAYVYWRADKEGKLISIRGEYNEEGCL
jgi:hypothetical protein